MLGAIRAHTSSGVIIDVGGGFTDTQRREIWDNQDLYLGKPFEVEARARFESGSLRHPNFVRWRFDK
jgi:ATP-dependent DNA ligase